MCRGEDMTIMNMIKKKSPPKAPPLPCFSSKKAKDNGSHCSVSTATRDFYDRLFDEAYQADVVIHTAEGAKIYAHSSILGMISPVFRHLLNQSTTKNRRRRSISILGVPHDAVRVFIRFLYSLCYNQGEMEEHILHLLVLSHVYVVPHLKRECEVQLENSLLNYENIIDVFQLALLCDAPRLSLICHRMILNNFKIISATEGWNVMKEAHPVLEKEIQESLVDVDAKQKKIVQKRNENKIYVQLYDAMEALVHFCRDGCKPICPRNKVPKGNEHPCGYDNCKGIERLLRHYAACKLKVPGGCAQCKRIWQLLELHSRLCIDSDVCRVPSCRTLKNTSTKQNKKEEMRWRILARKIVRSKSISGAPFFSLASST